MEAKEELEFRRPITFKVPSDLDELITREARRRRSTKSETIRQILLDRFARNGKEERE